MKAKREERFNSAVYLRQIPVFALRKQLLSFLNEGDAKKLMIQRMKQVLKKRSISTPKKIIEKLNRDTLVRIIKRYPEIDEARIKALFEEYRYGTNPSFFIYLFTPIDKKQKSLRTIQSAIRKSIAIHNLSTPKELPRVKNLVADDLIKVEYQPEVEKEAGNEEESKKPEIQEIIEGTYHFQRRLDLINDKENPVSIYETVYGFFWINQKQGYAVIQAHDRSILHALEDAIIKGAGPHIVNLTITKELKNVLPFLLSNAIFSSKLHDPTPGSRRIQKISFTDEHLYEKGYSQWEKRYPEVSSARYKIEIKGIEGQRILGIGFDHGEMSIAGKLNASQFRDWALNCLSKIIQKINDFENEPAKYIKTRRFTALKELSKYNPAQREVITKVLALLLDLKKNTGIGAKVLDRSALEVARDLKNLVYVQFKATCLNEHCTVDGYLSCPKCGGKFFRISEEDGKWHLTCTAEKRNNWSCSLPVGLKCEQEHSMMISARDLEDWIEILPNRELLDVISEIIKKYIPKTEFDGNLEYFMIHKYFLIHYKEPNDLLPLDQNTATAVKSIQARDVIGGNIIMGDGNHITVVMEGVHEVFPGKKSAKQERQSSLPLPP